MARLRRQVVLTGLNAIGSSEMRCVPLAAAWQPSPFSPPEARSPALSMRFRLCSPLWPTETSSALTCPPPSTRRMTYVYVRGGMVQLADRGPLRAWTDRGTVSDSNGRCQVCSEPAVEQA